MTQQRNDSARRGDLIEDLSNGLEPAASLGPPWAEALWWGVGSWLFVVAAALATGPMRPGFWTQLAASPQFLCEILLGLGAGALGLAAAVSLGVPRPASLWRRTGWAWLALLLWGGVYLAAFAIGSAALEPSMLGKRAGCYLQVLVFGLPPTLAGLAILRRWSPLQRVATGALVGAAAGAMPGLLMQLACMYEPWHILSHHIAPVAGLAALGAVLGSVVLRRI